MRGVKAKRIRRAMYGDQAHRNRRYQKLGNGQVVADQDRRMYQKAKKQRDA